MQDLEKCVCVCVSFHVRVWGQVGVLVGCFAGQQSAVGFGVQFR